MIWVLFQRRSFELTAAGEELYGFIAPFFEGLEEVSQKIREVAQTIRIAASTTIFRDHLPYSPGRLARNSRVTPKFTRRDSA